MQQFRKPLLILAGTIGGLILVLLLVTLLLATKAKTLAVNQINSYLSVPVKVDDIQFSILQNFPSASVRFEGVSSKGSPTEGALNNLASAEKIFLLFNVWDLFRDELHLKKIIISNASFYLFTDANGRINFDILKKQSNHPAATKIELESVQLENVHISYIDIVSKRDYRIVAQNTKLTGQLTNEVHDLTLNGPVLIERLRIDDINYLNHKQTEANLFLNIDSHTKKYTITNSTLQVADMQFDVNGAIRTGKENDLIDVEVKSKAAGIRELLSLIPGVYTERLNKYRYDGKVDFQLQIKSKQEKKSTPIVTASFNITDASLKTANGEYAFRSIYLRGDYTSRISETQPVSRVRLQNLRAALDGQPLSGNLLIENFKDPVIDLQINSKLQLETLSKFWMPDTLAFMKGQVNLNARIHGKSKDRDSWISEGTLEANNVSLGIKKHKQDFNGINGKITLRGNALYVSGLKIQSGGSDFTISGDFENAYGYLLRKTENLNGNLNINATNIDLGELLQSENTSGTDTSFYFDPNPRIHLNIQFTIGMIQIRKFQAWQVKGKLNIDGKIITADNLSFRGFEGNTVLSGKCDASGSNITIVCEADVKKLDINTLFYQLGNFGQNVIVADNVSGKLTATIKFAGTWSKDLHCNFDRIVAQSDLLIENGELKQFKPMLALNKYIKGADFQYIKFNTLKNQIDIRNQTITIPAMHIESSALDLVASGTHTFSNIVDYKLQLSLSQLLGRKVRSMNTSFGVIEDDGLGVLKVYLTMKGPMDNPKVVFDKKAVEQKIVHDIRQERKEFKKIILQEFGLGKKDTAKVKTPPKKQQELELETGE